VPFLTGVDAALSLRKNVTITDHRLPGGIAGGKIIGYSLSGDGTSGALKCEVTMACSVGKGGTVAAVTGTPTYCEEGYFEPGEVQRYEGQYVLPDAGDVAYESIVGNTPFAADDGFDFERLNPSLVIRSITKTNKYWEQEALFPKGAERPEDVFEILNNAPCGFEIRLKPLGSGPFSWDFNIATTELKIPKTIDLEADTVSS